MLTEDRRNVLNRALRQRLGAETIIQIEDTSTMPKPAKPVPAALTEIERHAIQGILDSEYMDGAKGQEAVDKAVWSWSANPFANKRTFSGAISSLVQKGFVQADDYGHKADEHTVCVTQAGMDAFLGRITTHITIAHVEGVERPHQVTVHYAAPHAPEVILRFPTKPDADIAAKAVAKRFKVPLK